MKKDINWAVKEICKAYGHAPAEGTAELFDILKELLHPTPPPPKIIDKYNLHPMGGYCTCFSHPHSRCEMCAAINAQQERWKQLTPEELAQAKEELLEQYPPDYGPEKGR